MQSSIPTHTAVTYPFGWQTLSCQWEQLDYAARLSLADFAMAETPRSARISGLLALVYDLPEGGFDPDRLSLIDRTAALFSIACRIGCWPARFVCRCTACDVPCELRVRPDEFAYEPGTAYSVDVAGCGFMQPNGHHEALLEDGQDLAVQSLAIGTADAQDLDETFATLETGAPKFTAALPYACCECGAKNVFWFDPLDWIARHLRGLLREVHILAKTYHWSEPEILALSAARRRSYLTMIGAGS
ncbi:hypothetical protein [Falsihalocynthiibacter arcticus]|uniref:Uncharacterized protein n=1 Tax=Falsihalocynthiibacter arcticus TaxID=1579316 RepID=A0A126V2J5_9RHOB|nr:hypothetical protein [Falsihalocynthiibacter arcticus]AML51929.1 hypothetical protein RC74_12215 [Falsihalocynthiibacter arcticus]